MTRSRNSVTLLAPNDQIHYNRTYLLYNIYCGTDVSGQCKYKNNLRSRNLAGRGAGDALPPWITKLREEEKTDHALSTVSTRLRNINSAQHTTYQKAHFH